MMNVEKSIPDTKIARSEILQVNNLSFRSGDHDVFEDRSVAIPPGVTLIKGGEGRGKSVLLLLLAGDLAADSGTMHIGGVSLQDDPDAYRRLLFRTDLRSEDFDQMTVAEYLNAQQTRYPEFDSSMLDSLIEGLSLDPHIDKKLFMLSTGSKRKVWLAAAFASCAKVVLLDEPFAALDRPSIGFVITLLKTISADPSRACVLANYEAPLDVPLAATVDLGD